MEIFITTSELLEKAEKLIGIPKMSAAQINYNKLLRWQREGLLPRQKSSGTGPGKRQESLWDRSCIERLQIIVGCVKGERLNRKTAENALISAGFGVQGELLKKHLLAACKQMSTDLEKQQRSESSDRTDQAANLERSTSDRMSAHGELVKAIFASCRLGYTGLSEEEECLKSFAVLASLFRPDALQELIDHHQPEQLELAYRNPLVITFAAFIAWLFDLMYGKSTEIQILTVVDNAILNSMFNMFKPKPDGKLRRKKPYPYLKERVQYNAHLAATLIYLVYGQYKEKLLPLIPFVVSEIMNVQKILPPDFIKNILNSKLEDPDALFDLPSMPK